MSRGLSLVFTVLLLLGLSACGTPKPSERDRRAREWFRDNGRVKVLCTVGMIEDLVRQIGGKHVDSLSLVSGQLDPHSYEMVKGDGEKLAYAQIIFHNGLGLEHGASLRRYLEESVRAVNLGASLLQKAPERLIRVDGVIDPHVWMDISLWALHIDPIVAALSSIDPEHQGDYRLNGEKLRYRMQKVHQEVRTLLQEVPDDRRFLVTSHDAFNYFTRAYLAADRETEWDQWAKRFQAPDGLAPDGQMGATDIKAVIDHLRRYGVGVIFPESNVSQDAIRKVVEAGAHLGLTVRICTDPLYGDAMGEEGSGAETYLGMIQHNAQVISHNLNLTETVDGSQSDL